MKSRFLYTFYNDFKVERFIARLDKLVTCQQTVNMDSDTQQTERARNTNIRNGPGIDL